MEPLFKISYVRDKKWLKFLYKIMLFRRPIMIIFNVLILLYFVFGIAFSVVNHYVEFVFLGIPLLWFIYIYFVYNRSVNIALKRDLEIHGKPIETSMFITDENIRYVQSTGAEFFTNYSDIKKVIRTNQYVVFYTKTKLYCAFKDDDFSVGNIEEFLLYLKNKGIKVK